MSKILFWRKSLGQKATEEYLEGWEGVPESDKQRRKLSASQLAIHLSKCKKDSPAYLLYKYELNRRIANIQAIPAWVAIAMIFVGIGLGWFLSQYRPFESKTSFDIIAEHIMKPTPRIRPKKPPITWSCQSPLSQKPLFSSQKTIPKDKHPTDKKSKQNNTKR